LLGPSLFAVRGEENGMATAAVGDSKREDVSGPWPVTTRGPLLSRAETLWTIFGATLFGAFLTYAALTGALAL
jgi:hypothetical protein